MAEFVVALIVVFVSSAASADLVERVVAVVDGEPILLSELMERAGPHVRDIESSEGEPDDKAKEKRKLYRELLATMIDERLILREGARLGLSIDDRMVEDMIARTAGQNGVSVDKLLEKVARLGYTPAQYREFVRRELLKFKTVQIRVAARLNPKPGMTPQEHAALQEREARKWLEKLRRASAIEVRSLF